MTESARRNRLADETSPYLLQHADNPVDWYPWGPEALDRAQHEGKPILLSIGYSACHWCHVMAHESFEDPGIAAVMNEHFINIKVDREERPDLDKIYQLAHQLLTDRPGGWPLTLFLTPDQTPFFGGTYFPADPRHGLPGFPDLLRRVAQAFREQGENIASQNSALRQALEQLARPPAADNLHADPMQAARGALAQRYDPQFGGFGRAPKFPQPVALSLLLRVYGRSNHGGSPDRDALHMVCNTLRRMALGGIYDQVGGGFARYATDQHWMIPHFEKMLYDNALLLSLYADAWHATGDGLFRRIALETAGWLQRDMQGENGGFYAALDADSEGEEGRYYVWQREEIESLLPAAERDLVVRRFGLDDPPNFEGAWHFHVHASFSELAKQLKRPREEVLGLWESARDKLRHRRAERVPPQRDDKIITAWNALAIAALARAGRVLGAPELVDAAERALSFIRETVWQDGRLAATFKDGRYGAAGFLDDYAFTLHACQELLQARWSDDVLRFAEALATVLEEHFQNAAHGGFHFTPDDHEALIQRPLPLMDDALPSGNGMTMLALNRLGHLDGDMTHIDAAERALSAAEGAVMRAPEAHCAVLLALDEMRNGLEQVVCRDPEADALQDAALRYFVPYRVVYRLPAQSPAPTGVAPAASGDTAAGPRAWLCTAGQCLPPVSDPNALAEQLASARRGG
ncbi:thioredoxin domain-containing protein [Ectothiorhodospiraceae bacterium WFHF3C12]|nr:thioredoxin domain-containing protein [Ectothiorhodospiraceae bacterium WFHF3C12]